MARPQKTVDWEEFDKLCSIQCTLAEIASWFDMSEDTIETICKREKKQSFSDYYKTKSAKGKMSLRRKQMQVALEGNVTMLIWMGKQILGQKDKQATEITGTDGGPVETRIIITNMDDDDTA